MNSAMLSGLATGVFGLFAFLSDENSGLAEYMLFCFKA